MKKLLIVFATIAPLWCMEPGTSEDQALATSDEHYTAQYLNNLADLLESSPRERPFGSIDPMDLARYEAAQSHESDEVVVSAALATTLTTLARTKDRFVAMNLALDCDEFSAQLTHVMSDERDLAELLTPEGALVPDRVESALAYLQKPAVLVPAALATVAVPPVTRSIRSQKRSPIALISSMVASTSTRVAFIASLAALYELKNGYNWIKDQWRNHKMERLTAALDKIDIVTKYQEALDARIKALEEAQKKQAASSELRDTALEQEIEALHQEQTVLKTYIEKLAATVQENQRVDDQRTTATLEAFDGIRHEVGEEAVTLAALKVTNQAIQAKLDGSLGIIARMHETLERLAAANSGGKKKK